MTEPFKERVTPYMDIKQKIKFIGLDTMNSSSSFIHFCINLLLSVSDSGSDDSGGSSNSDSVTSAWAVTSVVEAMMLTIRVAVVVVVVVETVMVMMMVTMIAAMLMVMVMVDIAAVMVVAAVVALAAWTASTTAASGSVTLVSTFSDCRFAVVFWGRVVDWHGTRNGDEGKEPDDEKFCHFVLNENGRDENFSEKVPQLSFD